MHVSSRHRYCDLLHDAAFSSYVDMENFFVLELIQYRVWIPPPDLVFFKNLLAV